MGISRDSMHKRRATGGKKKVWRKKRKYELGRQPANTKLEPNKKTVRRIRVRGGNVKWRALRLDTENYSWGSEAITRKTRLLDVEGEGTIVQETKKSNHVVRKLEKRQQGRTLDPHIEEQFGSGRLLACISSRPGQCGRADGYILEGKELEFSMKKIQRKKGKGAAGGAA
ncbi:40S ribosomal protein S8-2 [Abeliophyllum distichum]|uniref:40S ribosomal protein S8 n=1 Tax=Abeliophyllum distichum TaxID=126358 RepID=A0ABD1VTS5_9LAMI